MDSSQIGFLLFEFLFGLLQCLSASQYFLLGIEICIFNFDREYAKDCLKTGVDVVVLCDTNGGTMPWVVEVKLRM